MSNKEIKNALLILSVHASIAYVFFNYNVSWAYIVTGSLIVLSILIITYLVLFLYRYNKYPETITDTIRSKLELIRNSKKQDGDLYKGFSKALMLTLSFCYIFFSNSLIMGSVYAYFFVFIVIYDNLIFNILTKETKQ